MSFDIFMLFLGLAVAGIEPQIRTRLISLLYMIQVVVHNLY
jgi:hypothetical protein